MSSSASRTFVHPFASRAASLSFIGSRTSTLIGRSSLIYSKRTSSLATSAPAARLFSDATKESSDAPVNSLRFVSHLKNPIVHQLWTARGAAKASNEEQRQCLDLNSPRPPSQSETKISYPFSNDEFLKETYRNPWGQMRFGKILEDLDALAGNIAFAHVQDPRTIIVTASVDRIRLMGTASIDIDQHLNGKVTYVGTSSMEIRMQCEDDDGNKWMEAFFTFVATDPLTKRPERIAPLEPETPEEKAEFEAAANRAKEAKAIRNQIKAGVKLDPAIEKVARELLANSGSLLTMPSLAKPNDILVSQTELQNIEVAQPQARNMANQIFGGFLMRRACELAWSTTYAFGGERPIFYEVDQVEFSVPVNVGDMVNFRSRVLYSTIEKNIPDFVGLKGQSEIPLVSVEVEAWIIDPSRADAKLSNQFYFTFALPGQTNIRDVLPSNMEQARTMAKRMATDTTRN